MSDKELRDLDAWIAEHVMGWKWKECGITDFGADRPVLCWFDADGKHPCELPSYTTDPAAAMMVLEKCIKKSKTSVCQCSCPEGFEVYLGGAGYIASTQRAETLPVAICLFAKKLFS